MYSIQANILTVFKIGGASCLVKIKTNHIPFESLSKRRRGFPSETQVKRGQRIVGVDKYLIEKLGRNDPCPCGSGHRFQTLLSPLKKVSGHVQRRLLLGDLLNGI